MPHAIVLKSYGSAENMVYTKISPQAPGEYEVRIRNKAIGVNFIDVYYRTGLYPLPLPLTPGVEAAGIVEEVGSKVLDLKPGDRVAYGTAPGAVAAYATHTNIHQKYVVKLPAEIDFEVAATLMVKAITADYLLNRTFAVLPGNTILVHAAAGGVGTYLCQFANAFGATVIGTVSSPEKAAFARENGCTHPIVYTQEDFVEKVKKLTAGIGVPVVYDSVGKDTFMKSLECLCPVGLLVSYGQSSGKVPPFDILELAKKSNFVTRPSLSFFKAERAELLLSAADVFAAVKSGTIKAHIKHRFALKDAAHAHKLLESRSTMGSIVLLP